MRYLITCPDTIGDLVLRQPLFEGLLNAGHEIRLALRREYNSILPYLDSRLNAINIDFNPYGWLGAEQSSAIRAFLDEVMAYDPEVVISSSYQRTIMDDWVLAACANAKSIGFQGILYKRRGFEVGWKAIDLPRSSKFHVLVKCEANTPEWEKNRRLLSLCLHKEVTRYFPKLAINKHTLRSSRTVINNPNRDGYVVCCPTGIANIPIKMMNLEKYVEVIIYWRAKYGRHILLVGSKPEGEILREIKERCQNKGCSLELWTGEAPEIGTLVGLLSLSLVYFGNDTAPMHIASALNKPVIALFGGGHWPRFLPLASKGVVLTQKLPCFGCGWVCPYGNAPCIKYISTKDVRRAIDAFEHNQLSSLEVWEKKVTPKILDGLILRGQKIYWKTIDEYEHRVAESEADRAARLEVIEDLGKRLEESEADRVARLEVIEDFGRRLEESEADRVARLGVIEDLGKRLEESEVDRGARLGVIEDLGRRLEESEADRAARLEVIEDLGKRLEESEVDRGARLEVIQKYEEEMINTIQRLKLSNSILPKISIVTPSFNQGAYIEKTIQSVIDQGYPNLEYIVIDGGSNDGTLDIIRRFESHFFYWISEPDNGQAAAINKGFSKATGDLISWLNSDDTYTQGALWEWVKAASRYPKADIWMASHHNYIDEWDNVLSVVENIFVSHAEFSKYWKMGGIRVNQPSVFFRRQLLEEVGEIDPHLHYGLDYDFFLRLSRDHRIFTVNGKWVNYRLHRGAKSGTRAGEGFYKFIPEWHFASKKHWGRPWNLRWWGFSMSFQFYRPFFNLGQLTSDFISRRQMMLKWVFLWPRFLWYLITGQGSLPRW